MSANVLSLLILRGIKTSAVACLESTSKEPVLGYFQPLSINTGMTGTTKEFYGLTAFPAAAKAYWWHLSQKK
jgi:hypothetical protein